MFHTNVWVIKCKEKSLSFSKDYLQKCALSVSVCHDKDNNVVDLKYSLNWCNLDGKLSSLLKFFECVIKVLFHHIWVINYHLLSLWILSVLVVQDLKTLFVPLWKNNQGKRTFHYIGAKIWNKLSSNVRSNVLYRVHTRALFLIINIS